MGRLATRSTKNQPCSTPSSISLIIKQQLLRPPYLDVVSANELLFLYELTSVVKVGCKDEYVTNVDAKGLRIESNHLCGSSARCL